MLRLIASKLTGIMECKIWWTMLYVPKIDVQKSNLAGGDNLTLQGPAEMLAGWRIANPTCPIKLQ
jgi:hypothetical protein